MLRAKLMTTSTAGIL